jgi:hypothetical protein
MLTRMRHERIGLPSGQSIRRSRHLGDPFPAGTLPHSTRRGAHGRFYASAITHEPSGAPSEATQSLAPERPPASTLPKSAGRSHSTGPRGPHAALPLRSTSRSPAAPDEAASVFALQARSAARAPGPSNTRLPHRLSPRGPDSLPFSARKPGTRGTVSGSVITEIMCRPP